MKMKEKKINNPVENIVGLLSYYYNLYILIYGLQIVFEDKHFAESYHRQ